jgi:ribosomal protein S27E
MPKITQYKLVKTDGVVSLRYQCSGCGNQQETPVSKAGGRAQCFACGTEVDVPTVQELRDRASGKAEEPPEPVPQPLPLPPPSPPVPPAAPPNPAPNPVPTTNSVVASVVDPPVKQWAGIEAAIREQTQQDAKFYDLVAWRLFFIFVPFCIWFVFSVFMIFIVALGLFLGWMDDLIRLSRG